VGKKQDGQGCSATLQLRSLSKFFVLIWFVAWNTIKTLNNSNRAIATISTALLCLKKGKTQDSSNCSLSVAWQSLWWWMRVINSSREECSLTGTTYWIHLKIYIIDLTGTQFMIWPTIYSWSYFSCAHSGTSQLVITLQFYGEGYYFCFSSLCMSVFPPLFCIY